MNTTVVWLAGASATLATAFAQAVPPQPARNVAGGPLRAAEACYDARHYALDLRVDPAAKSLAGAVAMRATVVVATRRLEVDLDRAFTVDRVQLDGAVVPFRHAEGILGIDLQTELPVGRDFTLSIDYQGKPREARNPPWDGGFLWHTTAAGQPWITTCCPVAGGDLWWPCKDHPADEPDRVDLHVTVPAGLTVASNGTLQGEPQRGAGVDTWHWRVAAPIACQDLVLHIAPYTQLTETYECLDGTRLPVQWFVLPEHAAKARRNMPQFLDHLRGLEEILGPYPFRGEKYGLAETPFPGFGHQTMVGYGNGWQDEQYDAHHLRELARAWWGQLVTCRDWRDLWIHEGLGAYMLALYRERRFGPQAYLDDLRQAATRNLAPLAPRESQSGAGSYFAPGAANDLRAKSSWVLHTLRWQLGDETFFRALREFCYPTEQARRATDGTQCRTVDTEEFVALVSRLAGEDLGWFFAVYLRQPQLPRLLVEKQDRDLLLRWQVPDGLPFPLAVPLKLGGEIRRVSMPDGFARIPIGDADTVIDPEARLLMAKSRGRVR